MLYYVYTHAHTRLQNCEHFLTDNLIKAWDQYVIGERSSLTIDSAQKDGRIKSLTGTLWPGGRISRKRKGNSISSEVMVQVNEITSLVGSMGPIICLCPNYRGSWLKGIILETSFAHAVNMD